MGNKIQRGLGALLAALLLASAAGCQTREPVPVPTPGPTLAPEPTPKAKPLTNAEKTRQEGEAVIAGLMKKSLTYQPMRDPEDQFNLHRVKNVHMIGMVTGEYSENRTASQYGVGGTDLGLSVNKGEETFFFFGDTFKNEDQTEHWRSNVAAVSTDGDYTDGITFYRMIASSTGVAKELLRGKKTDG